MSGRPYVRSFLRRLLGAAAGGTNLLAPRAYACLLCGKPRLSGGATQPKLPAQLRQSLCGACLSAIPWIDRICCRKCGRGVHCGDCLRQPHASFVCNRSAVHYDSTMRGLLAQYKYRGNEQLAPVIGSMLLPAYERLTADRVAHMTGMRPHRRQPPFWHAITYVPVSAERAMERGFNQAEQLAALLSRHSGVPMLNLLQRSRHTQKQSFKSRSERLRDMRQLFEVNGSELKQLHLSAIAASRLTNSPLMTEKPLQILLIDDIYTTGSTAEECSRTLQSQSQQPMEIYILTWARS